MVSILNIYQ